LHRQILKRPGSAFDLPIAIGTLGATDQLAHPERLENFVIMGELSLDGEVRPIKGHCPSPSSIKEGFEGLIVPAVNAREAAMVSHLKVYALLTWKR
jgi:magnesium chelatase family protein